MSSESSPLFKTGLSLSLKKVTRPSHLMASSGAFRDCSLSCYQTLTLSSLSIVSATSERDYKAVFLGLFARFFCVAIQSLESAVFDWCSLDNESRLE